MKETETRFDYWQPLALAALLAAGMFIGTQLDDELPDGSWITKRSTDHPQLDQVIDVIEYVKNRYGEDLDEAPIAHKAIQNLIEDLDPHSYYLSGHEYRYFTERLKGSYTGIGINYETLDDTIMLFQVYSGSPAQEVGMQVGDMILNIDGKSVSGVNLAPAAVYEIWKEAGDEFTIELLSARSSASRRVSLKKRTIELNSVPAAFMKDSRAGYIKIDRFSTDTPRRFIEAIEQLNGEGLQDLVIDIRGNPGGNFQSVIKILDQLVAEKDQLMVYMDGKHLKRTEYRSTGKILFPIQNIVVLIDEHSVSASEVLAGALQDLDRATIVGRRSFGKALVQEMYELSEDAALNLTVGKYYMPSGRFIQKPYKKKEQYEKDLTARQSSGELYCYDSLILQSGSAFLSRMGRKLPAGEGVVPDICIPANEITHYPEWKSVERSFFRHVVKSTLVSHDTVADELAEGQMDEFPKQQIIRDFINNDPQAMEIFVEHGSKLEALFSLYYGGTIRYLFKGEKAYYAYRASHDPEIQKAFEVLQRKIGHELISHEDQL
ncbi:MAG: S41 family peptidase [Saprospiraceae bacterium]|nr:S41 family peptidase [Saprospiraceae bacterium]